MGVEFNIRDFVDVTITKRSASRKLTYDTVIYEMSGNESVTIGAYYANVSTTASGDGSTKEKAISYLNVEKSTDFYKWAELFFRNGGRYIHVLKDITLNVDGIWYSEINGSNVNIPLDEIVVLRTSRPISDCGSGINQKIFLVREQSTNLEGAAQFMEAQAFTAANIVSAAVAAYYTNIDIDNIDSVKDCMFTKINCTDTEYSTYSTNSLSSMNKDTFIVAGYLAGAYRLISGNDSLGNELTNVWAKIVLTQVLTNDLLTLLTSKIRLDSAGVASVKTCCSKVLNRFVNNGYISTEKAWNEADLYIDDELIAAENTPLIDGYKIHVGPITQTNITNHQLPPVYILYGDQVGVRKIVVTGEVF